MFIKISTLLYREARKKHFAFLVRKLQTFSKLLTRREKKFFLTTLADAHKSELVTAFSWCLLLGMGKKSKDENQQRKGKLQSDLMALRTLNVKLLVLSSERKLKPFGEAKRSNNEEFFKREFIQDEDSPSDKSRNFLLSSATDSTCKVHQRKRNKVKRRRNFPHRVVLSTAADFFPPRQETFFRRRSAFCSLLFLSSMSSNLNSLKSFLVACIKSAHNWAESMRTSERNWLNSISQNVFKREFAVRFSLSLAQHSPRGQNPNRLQAAHDFVL